MHKIDPKAVAKRYNDLSIIIDDDDKWHLKTKSSISKFIQNAIKQIDVGGYKMLNAGSAGYSYGLDERNILHVDIADKHLENVPNSIVANIEELPLSDNDFNMIICVGSVLNYCDPIKVIEEFNRVLKKDGYLILEFESSTTFELLFKKEFNKSAIFIETFFDAHGDKEQIWYFSDRYIRDLVKSYGFKPKKRKPFHIFSPLVYRITGDTNLSTMTGLDSIFAKNPILNKLSSNVIYLFKKE